MTDTPTSQATADPETLLGHQAWLRRLAGQLVADPHAADDLTQDTLIAALHRPGPRRSGVRAWLAGILRRRAADRTRAEARARRREAVRGPDDRDPASTLDAVERFERFREIVGAVDRLPPAMRTAVLLRYFEDLPPGAIARRLEIPVETVRTRLKRALARLRQVLDSRYGGRAGWAVPLGFLAPQAPVAITSSNLLTGAMWMTTKTKATLFLAVLLLGLLCYTAIDEPWATRGATAGESRGGTATATATPGDGAPERADLDRDENPFAGATAITGRLVDAAGRAAPRMALEFLAGSDPSAAPLLVTTGHDGTFTSRTGIPPGEYTARIRVGRPLVDRGPFRIDASSPPLHLRVTEAGRRDRITGVVLDQDGSPVPDATVRSAESSASTDRQGRFELRRQPANAIFGSRAEPREVLTAGRGSIAIRGDTAYEWGSTGVVLRLVSSAAITVRAIEADTGRAVPEFFCRLYFQQWGATGRNGVVQMALNLSLPQPSQSLRVHPKDPELLEESINIPRRALQPGATFTLKVHRRRTTRFRCVDRNGAPVAEANVEIVRHHSLSPLHPFDLEPFDPRTGTSSTLDLIAAGQTDGNGLADLEGGFWSELAPDAGPLYLLVWGPEVAPKVFEPGETTLAGGVHTAVVEAGGHLHGRIANLEGLQDSEAPVYVYLQAPNQPVQQMPPRRFAPFGQRVEPDGRFAIRHVPAGTWRVTMRHDGDNRELDRVTIRPGADVQIDLDARRLVPEQGTLGGTILINGEVHHVLIAEPSADTDETGRFGPVPLPVGRHSLDLAVNMGEGPRKILKGAATFDIAAGERHRLDLDVKVVRTGLRLLTVDGQPACFEPVHLRVGDEVHYTDTTDEQGRVTFFLQKDREYDVVLDQVGEKVLSDWHARYPGNQRYVPIGTLRASSGSADLIVR